uniref:Saposin B-type domain-containing protein n=1 Tax=Xiphophorus couchianus TaxID=32473 RepID=A0A3B5MG44_9TELE
FNPVCTLCLMVIKKLETMLPKNMTEKLMEEVCDLIPSSYKDQCNDFVDKYGAEIVEFLLSSAAPHTICSLLHLCFGGSVMYRASAVLRSESLESRTMNSAF